MRLPALRSLAMPKCVSRFPFTLSLSKGRTSYYCCRARRKGWASTSSARTVIFSRSVTLRIIFMGTPHFAVPALRALHDAAHEVVCVYTQPPRPAGRGKKLQPSPLHQPAAALGIPVRPPVSPKGADRKSGGEGTGVSVG